MLEVWCILFCLVNVLCLFDDLGVMVVVMIKVVCGGFYVEVLRLFIDCYLSWIFKV